MTSSFVTDGEEEVAFLRAMFAGDNQAATEALVALAQKRTCSGELPGTPIGDDEEQVEPDRVDLDGYAFVMSRASFRQYFPDVFNISVGGQSVPESSQELARTTGIRFVGTANSSIYVSVNSDEYPALLNEVECQLPSEFENTASDTRRLTISIKEFKAALRRAQVTSLAIVSYGTKEPLRVSNDESSGLLRAAFPKNLEWLERCLQASSSGRMDVGVVYRRFSPGTTLYVGRPGNRGGDVRIFPIGGLLQATTAVMRHIIANPSDTCAEKFRGTGFKTGCVRLGFSSLAPPAQKGLFRRWEAENSEQADECYKTRCLTGELGNTPSVSGVTSVVVYNDQERHLGLSVEERKFTQIGRYFNNDGSDRAKQAAAGGQGSSYDAPLDDSPHVTSNPRRSNNCTSRQHPRRFSQVLPETPPWAHDPDDDESSGSSSSSSGSSSSSSSSSTGPSRTLVPLSLPTPTQDPNAEELTAPVPPPPPPPPPPPAPTHAVPNQSREQREWDRDQQALSRCVAKLKRFNKARAGGLRSEAHVVFNNKAVKGTSVASREVVNGCLNDGLQAALFATDSRRSGLWANARVSHQVSKDLVDCSMQLAKSRRGREDRGLYLQAVVNQMGHSDIVDSVSRQLVWEGRPLQRLLRLLKAVSEIQQGFHLPSSSSQSLSDGVAFLVQNLDPAELALAETVMRQTFSEETLPDRAARDAFATTASVQLNKTLKTHTCTVKVPAPGGRRQQHRAGVVLARGTLAECSFAYELHQALLSEAYAGIETRSEKQTSTLRGWASMRGKKKKKKKSAAEQQRDSEEEEEEDEEEDGGEKATTCSYRMSTIKGINNQFRPEISPSARAIAASDPAKKLVFVHRDDINRAVRQQIAVIPARRSEVNDSVRSQVAKYVAEADAAYYKLRRAVADFCRARYIIQCRQRGQALPTEFLTGDELSDDSDDDSVLDLTTSGGLGGGSATAAAEDSDDDSVVDWTSSGLGGSGGVACGVGSAAAPEDSDDDCIVLGAWAEHSESTRPQPRQKPKRNGEAKRAGLEGPSSNSKLAFRSGLGVSGVASELSALRL